MPLMVRCMPCSTSGAGAGALAVLPDEGVVHGLQPVDLLERVARADAIAVKLRQIRDGRIPEELPRAEAADVRVRDQRTVVELELGPVHRAERVEGLEPQRGDREVVGAARRRASMPPRRAAA